MNADHASDRNTNQVVLWPNSACVSPPSTRARMAPTMAVTGWFSAMGCIQPGIDSTGTYALDTKTSGNTENEMPCAACALPEMRPRKICSQLMAAAKMTHSPNAAMVLRNVPCTRKPTAKPTTMVTKVPHMISAVSAMDRPNSTAARGIGNERNRSYRPLSASSATPTAPLANRPLTAASAGMRKSTYLTGPVWIAPPNT